MRARSVTWEGTVARAGHDAAEALPMDDEAFAGFHRRTAAQLWAYAARVSGNATLADDVVQESYLRLLTAALPEGEVARRRYLFRIATNLMRDHWRRPAPAALDELPDVAAAETR